MESVDELFEEPEDTNEQLKSLGIAIAEKRDLAVNGRKETGIEDTWMACEEQYLGVDNANRGEFNGAKWSKPTTMQGPVETGDVPRGPEVKSTLYVRLTSRYVDAASAKLGEIILPIDDKAFSFGPTPIADLVKKLEDETEAKFPDGTPMMRDATPEEMAGQQEKPGLMGKVKKFMGAQEVPKIPIKVKDFAKETADKALESAKKAEKRIHDWQVESCYQPEMRKILFDGARIGVGVLKAPFPKPKKAMAITNKDGIVSLQIVEKIIPGAKWVDPWNFFPDPSCGEDIHTGDYCLERDFLTARQLRDLKKSPGYIAHQIDKVIEEGPNKQNVVDGPQKKSKDNRFQVFYFYGEISKKDLAATGCDCEGIPEKQANVYVIATLVNDTVIKAAINPLDSGSFPYYAFPWQRRPGSWTGVGVAEQVAVPQRIVTAGTRQWMNNAGWSSGVQLVIDQAGIIPADGQYVITPNKIWYKGAEATADDVRAAFQTFVIPDTTASLQRLVEYGFRLAEESSSIPLITQGQSGKTTPDTLGGMQLQNNNANQLLRAVGLNVDDFITEPAVRAYYEWLLLDPDVPNDEKGDFEINAHGSSAMIERSIQDQTILQLGAMVGDPEFGMSKKKWATQMLKSKYLNPKDFEMDDAEKEEKANQPPPVAPQVEAAKIRSDTDLQKAQQHEQAETQRTQIVVGAADKRGQAQIEQEAADRAADREQEIRLFVEEYARMREIELDEAKVELAGITMKLTTQKELAGLNAAQVATPPTEPPGRADPGRAYQQ